MSPTGVGAQGFGPCSAAFPGRKQELDGKRSLDGTGIRIACCCHRVEH